MKKKTLIITVISFILLSLGIFIFQLSQTERKAQVFAKKIYQLMIHKNFSSVYPYFNTTMTRESTKIEWVAEMNAVQKLLATQVESTTPSSIKEYKRISYKYSKKSNDSGRFENIFFHFLL